MIGIGFKPVHAARLLGDGVDLEFVEVHAENLMGAGGPVHAQIDAVRAAFPLSVHGVGLSLGGEGPLDDRHLERLARVVARFEPAFVSEHLAWSTHGGVFFNDLLPIAYDAATLERVVRHVQQVQERLQRRVLIENPSTYVALAGSAMEEADFLAVERDKEDVVPRRWARSTSPGMPSRCSTTTPCCASTTTARRSATRSGRCMAKWSSASARCRP